MVSLKSQQAISSIVSSRLKNELDRIEKYSRKNCVVVSGLPAFDKLTPAECKIKSVMDQSGLDRRLIEDIDKAYPIGPVKNRKQNVIVRFKSHASRYHFFAKRKSLSQSLSVKPSLTRKRLKNFSETVEMVNSSPNLIHVVDFVFADINGDLKVPDSQGRYTFPFSSIVELAELIRGFNFRVWDAGASSAESDEESSHSEL